jgi:hypothetical protein
MIKGIKIVAVFTVLASSMLAQTPGFFVSAGGGVARMNVSDFTVTNPAYITYYHYSPPRLQDSEALPAVDKTSTVGVVRLTIGYAFTEAWDLKLSYANYGSSEVRVKLPNFTYLVNPNFTSLLPIVAPDLPVFSSNILKYQTSSFSLIPSYTHTLGKLRIKAGAGVNLTETSSHFETTAQMSHTVTIANVEKLLTLLPANLTESYSSPKEKENALGYLVSLEADYLLTDQLSVGITGNYSTSKIKVPTSPWAAGSKSNVNVNSLGAEFTFGWRW